MNKTYALVWNGAQRCWTAVGETARRRGKSSSGKCAAVTVVSLLGFAALPAFALPTGEVITSGKADIVRSDDGRTMNINQHTDKLITNWQDFGVAGGERLSFNQPNSQSLALNRVIGSTGSRIDGQITANGRVFLVNPNGVMFGAGAQVNVGGLVASTQNLSDADFLAGNYHFSGTSTQSVVNNGTITAADGGSVALLGARVANNGTIQARLGRVALGAGNAFTVNFDGSGLLNLQVDGGAVDAQASNGGLLKADGGEVLMTARAAGNLLDAVVNNTGTIEARGLNARGGKITLEGGTVNVAGKLDASAGEANAPAGSVVTRGERVNVASDTTVDTRAGNAAGTWTIEAANAGIGGDGGSIGADTLSRNLGTTNVALTNTRNDLTVDGPVTWTSDNALTLTSTAGNVNLNKTLSASGNDARLLVNAANRINVNDAVKLTGRNAHLELNSKNGHTLTNDKAVVTLSGDNASYRSNGEDYKVLHTLADLRNVDANLNGRYVLGNQIDGMNAGFTTIGGGGVFSGTFDGLGNTISRLTISNPGNDAVGLFGWNMGSIGNLKLDSLAVSSVSTYYNAMIGGLVGVNYGGRIHNVAATNMSIVHNGAGLGWVGGIVGRNLSGTIDNARFSGRLSGTRDTMSIGGIAGSNEGARATIENSRADADITITRAKGLAQHVQSAGTLVGRNSGTIANSSGSGRISAGEGMNVGGLVGANDGGTLRNVSASVNVSAGKDSDVGGLVGRATGGTIEHASASGTIIAQDAAAVGGLVGRNERGRIVDASSFASVLAGTSAYAGGLVGYNSGVLSNVSAKGLIVADGPGSVGGLVGRNTGTIENASADVDVSAGPDANAGGLVGTNGSGGVIRNASTKGSVKALLANVGGLVGVNEEGGLIENARASGVIGGTGSILGGLVAVNEGTIRSSESHTTLDANASTNPTFLGGLVGLNIGSIDSSAAFGPANQFYTVGFNLGTIDGKSRPGPVR